MSLNSVNIIGNLTRDPEIKYTSSGKSVCNLSIANNRVYTSNGERVTDVSYFDVEVWGATAENCVKYLVKGSGIVVEGRLKQDRWDKDGKTQSRVRISANMIHFLPKKTGEGSGGGGYNQQQQSQPQQQAQPQPQQQPAQNVSQSSPDARPLEVPAWDE